MKWHHSVLATNVIASPLKSGVAIRRILEIATSSRLIGTPRNDKELLSDSLYRGMRLSENLNMSYLELTSHSPEQTQSLGRRLGELAVAGDVLLLVGELGAGKTCLTQGIAWGLGINEYTLSPTFVIMRELCGRLPLYHIDLYRLDRIDEIADLGLEDYLYGEGVCVVEWAEKALDILPAEHLLIKINYLSDTGRGFQITPSGRRYLELVGRLKGFTT